MASISPQFALIAEHQMPEISGKVRAVSALDGEAGSMKTSPVSVSLTTIRSFDASGYFGHPSQTSFEWERLTCYYVLCVSTGTATQSYQSSIPP